MAIKIHSPLPGPKSVYTQHLGTLEHKQINGVVKIEKKVSGVVVSSGEVHEPVHTGIAIGPQMAKISVLGGRTLRTAPFEFVKIDVMLEMPCLTSDLEATYEMITDWVGGKLKEAEQAFKPSKD